MKKILIGIFSIILGFVGFSFGDYFSFYLNSSTVYNRNTVSSYSTWSLNENTCIMGGNFSCLKNLQLYNNTGFNIFQNQSDLSSTNYSNYRICFTEPVELYNNSNSNCTFYYATPEVISDGGGSSSCEYKNITVFYNSGSSESITCDGVQAIEIKGLSTLTSTNTFTPYFNISYKDEDNQSLVESYSKDNLYLENGLFKKTYTGNNDWILTYQGSSDSTFTGYVPVFDVTGSTQPIDTDYNMFNNFTDNSLKVLLSNIPGYIQYVFIIGIILLLLGIVKMFKRRK